MSETPASQFLQFWSELARGQPPSHEKMLSAFQGQLATLAGIAGAEQGATNSYREALLSAFRVFAPDALRPPPAAPADEAPAACLRFSSAASELQLRFAQATTAAVAEVQALSGARAPQSLQELFDRWVERYERQLFELLTEPAFGTTFGDAVNAALECYRDAVGLGMQRPAERSQAVTELQHDLEALTGRVAELEAPGR